jgi:hypothetical protein
MALDNVGKCARALLHADFYEMVLAQQKNYY